MALALAQQSTFTNANGEDNSIYGKRRRYMRRFGELDSLYRRSWMTTHQDIIEYIQPNRGEFLDQEVNMGNRRDSSIVNNTATDSADKLAAAMDTGITSEAREWFTLGSEDPQLAENDGIREYLHTCQSALFALIARSSFYVANRNLLEDLIGPAVGLMLIDPHPTNVWQCEHVPIGSYRLSADSKGKVNGVYRPFTLTASQMFTEFGEENVSQEVLNALRVNIAEQVPFRVLHVIEERGIRQYGKIDSRSKPWASVWMEIGQGFWGGMPPPNQQSTGPVDLEKKLLRESGYDEQPFIAPRWKSIGRDPYGKDSPGWKALGDVKGLQSWEMSGASGAAKILDPPLNVPDDLANASLLPGALNRMSNNSKVQATPTVAVPPEAVTVFGNEAQRFERRIDRAFFGDVLFLLSRDESAQPKTAEEIRGKKEERLLQLGGVFARYADEALKPAIARMFAMAQRAGKLPLPPQALLRSGKVRIDFQNPLVTAQKTIGFTAMGQLVSFGIATAQARTAGADKIDTDEMMDTAAEMLGVKPNLLKSDDQLAQERQAAAQQQQAAQQGAAMTQAAPAIRDLSNADPEKLRSLLSQFGPAAVSQGVA